MVLGDLEWYTHKREIRSPTYTIHKNKFKVDKDLNISHDTIKVLQENMGKSQTCLLYTSDAADEHRDV